MNGSSDHNFFPPAGKGHFPERCPETRFEPEHRLQTTGPKACALMAYELCDRNVIQCPHKSPLYMFGDPLTEVDVLTS